MLRVDNLTCGYGGEPVVRDVSFRVEAGEKLCILGPNGCGKTTLLRAVCGMLPSRGTVLAGELDIKKAGRREVAKKMALLSQISSIYYDYTVYQTVLLGRYAHQSAMAFSGETAGDKAIVEDSLEKTGLAELRGKSITELSGGQLQRVFLARVFAQDPQIILLDEPTNHLDLHHQVELVRNLREWAKRGDRCVVGVFHDINLALSFADSVLLMQQGRLVAHQPAERFDLSLFEEIYEMNIREYMQSSLRRWERENEAL